ncbi:MAG: hypothetical protein ACF8R7_05435 [Phycisphaerales bacterium JB039]
MTAAGAATGEASARARRDRWAHRRAEPRMLAFLWTMYLLAATALAFLRAGLVEPIDAHVYRVSARALLVTIAFGACILWPMVRLSQELPRRPVVATLKDLVIIIAPMQAVIWGQALVSGWPLAALGAVSLALAGWTGICAGVLLLTIAPGRIGPGRRVAGMLAVLAVTMLGGLVPLRAGVEGQAGLLSPFTAPFALVGEHLTKGYVLGPTPAQWRSVAGLCLLAPVPWLVAGALGRSQ